MPCVTHIDTSESDLRPQALEILESEENLSSEDELVIEDAFEELPIIR